MHDAGINVLRTGCKRDHAVYMCWEFDVIHHLHHVDNPTRQAPVIDALFCGQSSAGLLFVLSMLLTLPCFAREEATRKNQVWLPALKICKLPPKQA